MLAVTQERYGAPADVMALGEIPRPEPGAGKVLVRVHAAAANPADWHIARGDPAIARLAFGLRGPRMRVLGSDLAGTVEAVGAGVTTCRAGDEVLACTFQRGFGAFAEAALVPAELAVAKPAALTFEQAAALPLAGLTALQAVRDHGRVTAGSSVLVIGAAGGVGSFAVQLAKAFGAHVTGVCRTANVELVRSLGADRVVDRTREDPFAERHDVVVQAAGTTRPRAVRRALAPGGTLVAISGDGPGHLLGPVPRALQVVALDRLVPERLVSLTVKAFGADLAVLAAHAEAGALRPVLDRTFSLAEVPQALAHLEAGRARGKVVIGVAG